MKKHVQRSTATTLNQIKHHIDELPQCGGCEAQSIHRGAIHEGFKILSAHEQAEIRDYLAKSRADGMIDLVSPEPVGA